jgi:hypothetical protein
VRNRFSASAKIKISGEPGEDLGVRFKVFINRFAIKLVCDINSYRVIPFFMGDVELYSPQVKLKFLLNFARKAKKIIWLEQWLTSHSRDIKNLANNER